MAIVKSVKSSSSDSNNEKPLEKTMNKSKVDDKENHKSPTMSKSSSTIEKSPTDSSSKDESLKRLYSFLNTMRTKDGKNATHCSIDSPKGGFCIEEHLYSKFKKLYIAAILDGHIPHITELHRPFGPIVLDFDFVQSTEERRYTDKTIRNIVKIYNDLIKKYLKVTPNMMMCYVMEKKKSTLRSGTYHDGIHMVYPYICTKPAIQHIIRREFIKLAKKHDIFTHMKLDITLEKIVDEGVIYNSGWLMYKSRKNKQSYCYDVTHIYRCDNKNLIELLLPGEKITDPKYVAHFVDVISVRRFFSNSDITETNDNVDLETLDKKTSEIINDLKKDNKTDDDIKEHLGNDYAFIKAVPDDILAEARNLVSLFSKKRATDYHSWIQVGCCLHNIDNRLLKDWIKFSKKCPEKFKEGQCEELWRKIKSSNYTMASLHFFARTDNPKGYMRLNREVYDKLMRDSLVGNHRSVARVLMAKYKHRFMCASLSQNLWYEFKNHRWEKIQDAYTLRNNLCDELKKDYEKLSLYYATKAINSEGFKKEECKFRQKSIERIVERLGDTAFCSGVIKQCSYMTHDPEFLKNLDENIYTIGFTNGVYDLEADCFRAGCPDDYISMCTNYPYIPYNKNDETVKEINDFFEKIQPDKEMREYLMMLLSTCIAGSICEESMYVMTGGGSNGKSKLFELLKYSLGDLFKQMDVLVLTQRRTSSSAATPEIADKKGVRACTFDEPDSNDCINASFMKLFTSDSITARGLFQDPVYFKPQFKPFLLCNKLPKIKEDDDGTWRRIKVIAFLSRFWKESEVPKKFRKSGFPANNFVADLKLSEKMRDWKQMFMAMLIKYYAKYKKGGLIHPKSVTEDTNNYRKKCDLYQEFIGDYLDKTSNKKDTVSVVSLHDGMNTWHRMNYQTKAPSTKELRSYIETRLSNCFDKRKDILIGYRFKTEDDTENFPTM